MRENERERKKMGGSGRGEKGRGDIEGERGENEEKVDTAKTEDCLSTNIEPR